MEFGTTVNTLLDSWQEFSNSLMSFPYTMHDAAVAMAASLRDKVDEYRLALTSPQSSSPTDGSLVVIYNRTAIDSIRRHKPELYMRLLQLGSENRPLTDAEMASIQAIA